MVPICGENFTSQLRFIYPAAGIGRSKRGPVQKRGAHPVP